MGLYIKPVKGTKEDWLVLNAKSVNRTIDYDLLPKDHLFIVLLDNGLFTAAGVAYSKREYEDFMHPADLRPKTVWIAPISKIKEVCPDIEDWVKGGY